MLVLDRASGRLADPRFENLPQLLQPGDLLPLHAARVLPARQFAGGSGGGTRTNSRRAAGLIEVLLTEEVEQGTGNREQGTKADSSAALRNDKGTGNREQGTGLVWRALVKPAKKVRVGETLLFFAAGGYSGEEMKHPPAAPPA